MNLDIQNLFNSMNSSFERMKYIRSEDVPSIDLYMDQVTTFLDEELKHSSRVINDEKLITKTMINNYAKNDVIPPPVKKKYTKEHVLVLIMMYYFKSFLQINDIKELFDPLNDKYFGKDTDFGIEEVYNNVFREVGEQIDFIHDDVMKKFSDSLNDFQDAPKDEQEYLQLYSFVCKLGCDVFIKKLMIEKIVDSLKEYRLEEENKNKEPKRGKDNADK